MEQKATSLEESVMCKTLDTNNVYNNLAEMRTTMRGENDRLEELQRSKTKLDWTLHENEAVIREREAELTAFMNDGRNRLLKVDRLTNATAMQLSDADTAVVDWTDRRKRMTEVYEKLRATSDANKCAAQTMLDELQREHDRLEEWISNASDRLMAAEFDEKNMEADTESAKDRLNITKVQVEQARTRANIIKNNNLNNF